MDDFFSCTDLQFVMFSLLISHGGVVTMQYLLLQVKIHRSRLHLISKLVNQLDCGFRWACFEKPLCRHTTELCNCYSRTYGKMCWEIFKSHHCWWKNDLYVKSKRRNHTNMYRQQTNVSNMEAKVFWALNELIDKDTLPMDAFYLALVMMELWGCTEGTQNWSL